MENSWLIKKLNSVAGLDHVDETDMELANYLHEINSYHVEKLTNEPKRLAQEKTSLEEDTENLTFANYKTFIQVADCSKKILHDFVHVHDNVDHLLTALPSLDKETHEFSCEAAKINTRRAKNSMALRKHTQILEILEIPQVMETCVRAGYYEDALHLINHTSKMERRLGHIDIVRAIIEDMKRQKNLFLETLLEQLTTNINLSNCLKIVSFLRRLEFYTETQLRIKFLTLRGEWLDNTLATIPTSNAYEYVSKMIELWRVNLPDIMSQYKASFSDDDPLSAARRVAELGTDDSLFPSNNQSILSTWLIDRSAWFLASLKQQVTLSDGFRLTSDPLGANRLESIVTQAVHLGLSLGRLGFDVRHIIMSVVDDFVKCAIDKSIDHAYKQFEESFETELASPNFTKSTFKKKEKSDSVPKSSGAVVEQPPLSLVQSPSLALFCNALIRLINNFRSCCSFELASHLHQTLQANLTKISDQICKSYKNMEDGKKKTNLKAYLELYSMDLLPFLQTCVASLYPLKEISQSLGLHLEAESLQATIPTIGSALLMQKFVLGSV